MLRFCGLLFVMGGFTLVSLPLQVVLAWFPFFGVIWERVIFKLFQLLGTMAACGFSAYYFLQFNDLSNLTIWDLYFGVAVILSLIFINQIRVTVSSGGNEIYSEEMG